MITARFARAHTGSKMGTIIPVGAVATRWKSTATTPSDSTPKNSRAPTAPTTPSDCIPNNSLAESWAAFSRHSPAIGVAMAIAGAVCFVACTVTSLKKDIQIAEERARGEVELAKIKAEFSKIEAERAKREVELAKKGI